MKKNFLITVIFLLSLNLWINLGADMPLSTRFDEHLKIGELTKNDDLVWFGTQAYPIYKLYEEPFILWEDLQNMGVKLEQKATGEYIIKGSQDDLWKTHIQDESLEKQDAFISNKILYVDHIRSYSIETSRGWFIPFRVLKVLWNTEEDGNTYLIQPRVYMDKPYLEIDEMGLRNLTDTFLTVSYVQVYWDKDHYVEKTYQDQLIEPFQVIPSHAMEVAEKEQMIYLTTRLQDINGIPFLDLEEDYGQKATGVYIAYTKAKRLCELESVFPKYKVIAKVKYSVAGFKEGQEVELWRSEKGQYHVLKREDGKKIVVPLDSIEIIRDTGKGWDLANTLAIEDYVNLKNYESDTDYLIWTDVYRQLTYVLQGQKGAWHLVKSMKCSTGKNTSLTPTGVFQIEYKMPYFGMDKGYRCKNALVIFKDYMYHSILFDVTGKYIRSGQYQLGARVSHGCVRLSEEDSRWLYINIPEGTKVYIE